jgi:hypothetical protein
MITLESNKNTTGNFKKYYHSVTQQKIYDNVIIIIIIIIIIESRCIAEAFAGQFVQHLFFSSLFIPKKYS